MAKLPNHIYLKIKNFEIYFNNNKFKDSYWFLKVDWEFLDEMHLRGLTCSESMAFMRLLLVALRQRCDRISLFCDRFEPFIPDFEIVLRRLISKDFIELDKDIVFNKLIKKKKKNQADYPLIGSSPKRETESLNSEEIAIAIKNISSRLEKHSEEISQLIN